MIRQHEAELQRRVTPEAFDAIDTIKKVTINHLFSASDPRFPEEKRKLDHHNYSHTVSFVYGDLLQLSLEGIHDGSLNEEDVVETCVSGLLHDYQYDPRLASITGRNEEGAAEAVPVLIDGLKIPYFQGNSRERIIERVGENILGTSFTLDFNESGILTAINQRPQSDRPSQLLLCDADLGGIAADGDTYIARNLPFCLEQSAEVTDAEERVVKARNFFIANLFLIADHPFKTIVYNDRHSRNKASAAKKVEEIVENDYELNLLVN